MPRARLLTVLGTLVAALTLTAPAAAREAPETIVQDDAELLFRSDERVAESMRHLRSLGVDRVRLNAGWSSIAPHPESMLPPMLALADPDAYPRVNWRRLDRAVRAANDAGLQVMIDIAFWAPRWATSGNPNGSAERQRWDIDPVAFSQFTAALVKRYSGTFTPEPDTAPHAVADEPDQQLLEGPLGELLGGGADPGPTPPPPPAREQGPLPKVSWWTIWNEPNHPGFLQPQYTRAADGRLEPNTPHLYRRMVEASQPVIKQLQPDSTVLVGGLASFGVKNPSEPTAGIPPLKFVRELACVDEQLRPLATPRCRDYKPLQGDGFAHHPYSLLNRPDFVDPANPDSARVGALDRLSGLLAKLARAGRIDPRIANLYLTEFGYETNPPDPVRPYGLAQQAHFLNWAEYLAWKNPQVRSWPQFLLRDLGVVSAEKAARGARPHADYQTGLLFEDGTPKPSAQSFKNALFVDCVSSKVRPARRKPRKRKPRVRGKRKQVVRKAAKRRKAGKRRGTAKRRKLGKRAKRAPRQRLLIWGHVRPGASPQRVVLEESRAGVSGWRASRTAHSVRAHNRGTVTGRPVTTSPSGIFVRHAAPRAGVLYRLRIPATGETGVPVRPVRCGRKPELVARQDGEY